MPNLKVWRLRIQLTCSWIWYTLEMNFTGPPEFRLNRPETRNCGDPPSV